MARLKFVPKAGLLVPYPGRGPGENHHAGRAVVVDEATQSIANPVHDDCIDVLAGSAEAERFIQLCRRDGDVHPVDEATAKACGVPFVRLGQRADGEWIPETATNLSALAAPKGAQAEQLMSDRVIAAVDESRGRVKGNS